MSGSIRKMPIMAMRSKQAYELEQKAIEYLRWAQKQNWDGVASAFASGAAEGMVSASESALDGSTLGAYSWLDNKYDFGKARRQQEVQQLAESANLGTAYQIANTAAEVGGGMRGAAVKAWNLGAAAAKAIPLINKSKIIAPAIGGAGLSSLTENSFKYDFSDLQKIGLGTLQGTAAAVALVALQSHSWDVLKKFFPEANLAGIKGGIDNVVQSEKAAETVQKGMAANPELAQDVADQLPRAIERINKNTADTVNQTLKQRIDVPQTVANRQAQFDDYLRQHAADEVWDFAPRQQLDAIPAQSNFSPENFSISQNRDEAQSIIKEQANDLGKNIFNNDDILKNEQAKLLFNDVRHSQDIHTAKEVWKDFQGTQYWNHQMAKEALQTGNVTVYSTEPVLNFEQIGAKVTPSLTEAQSLFTGEKIYKHEVPITDIAWLNSTQGYYAQNRSGVGHFLDSDRISFTGTLKNTVENPDITFNQRYGIHYIKKYNNNQTNKEFYDIVYENNGDLYGKFIGGKKYVLTQFKEPMKDLSFHRRPSEASGLRINLIPTNDTSLIQNNIYANGAVVNNNLKNIFDIYKTLSFNQQKLLHEAFNNVLNNSTAKAGSFENLQSAIRELDKMAAVKSQNGINPAEAADMLNLQNLLSMHLGELYRQKALKLAKVKPMEEAYKAGLQTKPLPQTASELEQTAYAQGKFNNMTANNAQNNLAQQVLQEPDINKQIYDKIHLWLQQQNEAYQRSKLLKQQAQRWMLNEQKPRNYIEQIRYYLETDAGRKALNRNFDGTNKWYSRQPEPYFINSMVQNHDK